MTVEKKLKPIATILVVDDEEDVATIVTKGLQHNRFEAMSFTNPILALGHFRTNPEAFCLVLSDIRMPGMTGFQLVRQVKDLNPSVKTMLMTSFEVNRSEFDKVLPSTAVDDFVQKPIRIDELCKRILKQISQMETLRPDEAKKQLHELTK